MTLGVLGNPPPPSISFALCTSKGYQIDLVDADRHQPERHYVSFPWVSLSAPHRGLKEPGGVTHIPVFTTYMIVVFEILFAIWIVHELAAVLIGLTLALDGLAAQLVSFALVALGKLIEIICCLWITAFFEDEA